jgi:hypothetical protein
MIDVAGGISTYQIIVRQRDCSLHCLVDKSKIVGMIPVAEHNRANVDIVICSDGTMDNHRAQSTAGILGTVVSWVVVSIRSQS